MENEKHPVDQLFRDALIHQEKAAPPETWSLIEGQLQAGERKRNIILWRSAAASALVLISLGTGYFLGLRQQPESKDITGLQKQYPESAPSQSPNPSEPLVVMPDIHEINSLPPSADAEKERPALIASRKAHNNEKIASGESSVRDESTLALLSSLQASSLYTGVSAPDFRRPAEKFEVQESGPVFDITYEENAESGNLNRWSIGGQASPLYAYRDVRNTSAGLNIFAARDAVSAANKPSAGNEHPVFSYSGNLNVSYALNEHFEIESGLGWSSTGLGMTAKLPYGLASSEKNDLSSLGYVSTTDAAGVNTNSTGTIEVLDAFAGPTGTRITEANLQSPMLDANITQYLGYLEVPMLLKWNFAGSRLKLGLHGGLITNILAGNRVVYETKGQKVNAGPTEDLRTLNYSGALGLGASMPIGSHWKVKLEPSFRYFINPIYSKGDYSSHPYSMGVFTGMSYSF